VSGQPALPAGYPPGGLPLPAIVTRAFLGIANAHLGRVIPLPVGNATVPVRPVAAIRAFPSAGGAAPAVIVDLSSLESVLTAQSQPPVPVTGWWLRTAPGSSPRLPAGATAATRAGAAAELLGDPLPNVPQLALLVIALAAALLSTIGFLVCGVAAGPERRVQDVLSD